MVPGPGTNRTHVIDVTTVPTLAMSNDHTAVTIHPRDLTDTTSTFTIADMVLGTTTADTCTGQDLLLTMARDLILQGPLGVITTISSRLTSRCS